jgi:hypothetical protein
MLARRSAKQELERLRAELRLLGTQAADRDLELVDRLRRLELQAQIPVVMEWARRAPLAREPRVSVILPTRDRCDVLPRAIASVLGQSYSHWELVIVNDGSEDDTARVLEAIDDERIRVFEADGVGASAARNVGLAAARGELIAYLDDDNLMHEGWLRTIVWAFEQRPDADVAYGAFVLDDPDRIDGRGSGRLPELAFNPFDRNTLATTNPADISAVAHRAGLPGAHFDEGLEQYGDWELLARLAGGRDPFAIPAIACFYATDARDRLSEQPVHPRELEAVARATRG